MNRIVHLFLICSFIMAGLHTLPAQKVGYVNLEAIMALMPEMKKVNDELGTYRQKLEEQLKVKQDYASMKYQEYLEIQESGAEEEKIMELQQELNKLQQEIQTYAQESDQKFTMRRQDAMQPIFDKLQGELDKIAQAEEYDIIINAVDGSGLSIVLYGPEEHNLTKKILDQMGIEVPDTASAEN